MLPKDALTGARQAARGAGAWLGEEPGWRAGQRGSEGPFPDSPAPISLTPRVPGEPPGLQLAVPGPDRGLLRWPVAHSGQPELGPELGPPKGPQGGHPALPESEVQGSRAPRPGPFLQEPPEPHHLPRNAGLLLPLQRQRRPPGGAPEPDLRRWVPLAWAPPCGGCPGPVICGPQQAGGRGSGGDQEGEGEGFWLLSNRMEKVEDLLTSLFPPNLHFPNCKMGSRETERQRVGQVVFASGVPGPSHHCLLPSAPPPPLFPHPRPFSRAPCPSLTRCLIAEPLKTTPPPTRPLPTTTPEPAGKRF